MQKERREIVQERYGERGFVVVAQELDERCTVLVSVRQPDWPGKVTGRQDWGLEAIDSSLEAMP